MVNLSVNDDETIRCVSALDHTARNRGLANLSAKERYRLIHGIARLQDSSIDALTHCDHTTKNYLHKLREKGLNTYARTAMALFAQVDPRSLYELDKTPLPDGPVVIIVAIKGSQVPVSGPTIGNELRKRRNVQPPIGPYYTACLLQWLGVNTYVFNLALGKAESDDLEETVSRLCDRIWFISFASNFLGKEGLDSIFDIHEKITSARTDGLVPRVVAGGMGASHSRDVYLRHTPVDVVIGRYGGLSFADMIFASHYSGPGDTRTNFALFQHIPNLHIAVNDEDRTSVHSTREEPYLLYERRVLANRHDVSLVPYQKYWKDNNAIDVCSADCLNIPTDYEATAVGRVISKPEEASSPPRLQRRATSRSEKASASLHPSNYIHKPRTVKVMTTYGNCLRACEHCVLGAFGIPSFANPVQDVIAQFNHALEVYPEIQMFVIDDDDFLLSRKRDDTLDLISALQRNGPTKGKTFHVETAPVEVDRDIMRALYRAGFRGILLGLESPIERIVRDIGKIKPVNSFQKYVEAPRTAYECGFYTRISTIPFYPIVTEEELVETILALVEFIDYGISVSVFPMVQALPGINMVKRNRHRISTSQYRIPRIHHKPGGAAPTVHLLHEILPDDPVVEELAMTSCTIARSDLEALLARHGVVGDYPMSLGVLAFLRSIVRSWHKIEKRSTPTATLKDVAEQVDVTIELVRRTHFAQLALQQAVYALNGGNSMAHGIIEASLRDGTLSFVLDGLRSFLDFGNNDEVAGAAQLLAGVLDGTRQNVDLLRDSLSYSLRRASLSLQQRRVMESVLSSMM